MNKGIAIISGIVILLCFVFVQVKHSFVANQQTFVYPIDDTYIHMTIAENLAKHGQWGLEKTEFVSTSSSILYTLTIAILFKLFDSNEWIPLIVNIFAGIGVLLFMWKVALQEKFNAIAIFLVVSLVIFLTPFPALIISGMEHTTQILIDCIFIYYAARFLEDTQSDRKRILFLSLFACLSVMIRFEGLFLIFIVSFLSFCRDKKLASVLILFSGILPVLIFGLISIVNGAYFLPNSLLIKGQTPDISFFGLIKYFFAWLGVLKNELHLFALFIVITISSVYYQIKTGTFWCKANVLLVITTLTLIIHLTFARTGWFFRYDAYLIFLSLFSLWWIINSSISEYQYFFEQWRVSFISFLFLMTIFYPLFMRGRDAANQIVPATKNIYSQQYQMAKFLGKYYSNSEVCINDIGAVSFFTNVKVFDIFGLASNEIMDLRLSKKYNASYVNKLTRSKHIRVAIIYDKWFIDQKPVSWKKAGEWQISDNVVNGDDVVSFYAINDKDLKVLKRNLSSFSSSLPEDVKSTLF